MDSISTVPNVVDWRSDPGVTSTHPYNRELVTSRLVASDDQTMVWYSDQAGWRITFTRER